MANASGCQSPASEVKELAAATLYAFLHPDEIERANCKVITNLEAIINKCDEWTNNSTIHQHEYSSASFGSSSERLTSRT